MEDIQVEERELTFGMAVRFMRGWRTAYETRTGLIATKEQRKKAFARFLRDFTGAGFKCKAQLGVKRNEADMGRK